MSRSCLIALTCLLTSASFAQVKATFGLRGEVSELRVGDTLYFTDIGVTLIKPDWAGALCDQRKADPAAVTVEQRDGATVYAMTLTCEGGAKVAVREVVRVTPDKVSLEYEVTPEQDIMVENILLQGTMPTAVHAGKTKYVAADGGVVQGVCPADAPADSHIIFGGRSADWVGFAAPGGPALRVTPRDLSVQFQDNRKWNVPDFSLLAMTGHGKLAAGTTTRFGMTYAADTPEKLEADTKELTRNDLAGLKLGDGRALKVLSVTADRKQVEACTPVELTADIAATYDNPFDPDQIAVDAEVTGPEGKMVAVPGFYYVPMRTETRGETERMRMTGPPSFRVRYSPPGPGGYRIVVTVTDRSGTVKSAPVQITATARKSPGFVRVAKGAPAYFAYDSGQPYFAVGENVCWSWGAAPVARYTEWFKGLGDAGGNWARVWLSNNEKGQEWMAAPTPKAGNGTYMGLGKYALDNACRLDEIVRLGEANGIRMMLCLGTYGEFTEGGYFNEGSWISNPYNAKNGGPCAKPEDFWTNELARKTYQKRLRYLIARWGYSANIFGWEFWNEVPPSQTEAAWIAEMARYFKQHDPYQHLVSTTYGDGRIWNCPDVDFTMKHMYGTAGNTADFTGMIVSEAREGTSYGKPYLLAEFGIDWQTDDSKWDPKGTGYSMHNGAWASLMSGAAGTSMLWYWDGYVQPLNVYHVLTPVRKFADTIDWAKTRFTPIAGLAAKLPADQPETFTDLTIPGGVEWGITPSAEYTVKPDGSVLGGPIAMTIGSPKRGNPKELHAKLTWHLDMPKAGKVIAHLGNVCTKAHLQIAVDGEVKVDRELAAGEMGKGPWKSAKLLTQYNCWISDYDEDIPIEVPAGKHDVTLANTDGDWVQINSIRLPGYRSSRYPDVNLVGVENAGLALVWVHNGESTWRTEFGGKQPAEIKGLTVTVPVAGEGTWRAEWWDTFKGEVIRRDVVVAKEGKVELTAPNFARDLAVKVGR